MWLTCPFLVYFKWKPCLLSLAKAVFRAKSLYIELLSVLDVDALLESVEALAHLHAGDAVDVALLSFTWHAGDANKSMSFLHYYIYRNALRWVLLISFWWFRVYRAADFFLRLQGCSELLPKDLGRKMQTRDRKHKR